MEVLIDNRQNKINITENIKEIIGEVIKESLIIEGRSLDYEVSVSLVDKEEIQMLNREYRGVDRPTDVLSFPMEEDEEFMAEDFTPILGDIIICAQIALEQSEQYGHTFIREIAYLTAHSMFHLMGYDHESEEEREIMRNKEKEVMKKIKIFK